MFSRKISSIANGGTGAAGAWGSRSVAVATSIAVRANCPSEHSNGIMRNNIIMNCPRADGIYINNARDIRIYQNTMYRAYGVMLRFPNSTADIRNNIISGAISLRDDAQAFEHDNLETGFAIGSYIQGAADKLSTTRISDYDAKFPSVFDRDDITGLQDSIGDTADWLGESAVGRGDGDFDDWFVSPETGDLSLYNGSGHRRARRLSCGCDGSDFCDHDRSPAPRGPGRHRIWGGTLPAGGLADTTFQAL